MLADGVAVVAQRLSEAAEALTRPWRHASTAVVRARGDEFVVALHCPDRLPLRTVTARLRDVAGPVDLGLEEPVGLEFSLGIAESNQPVELASLLKAADLAAYEDKRRRAQQRVPTQPDRDSLTILP